MKRIAGVVFVLALAAGAHAQQDFSKVEVTVTKVAGPVSMLQGAGGNIGVSAGEDGVLVVDDQYAPLAPKIKAAIRTITDKPIRLVVNTHYHGDHTGGNEFFGAEAPIIAQENVRKRLASGSTVLGNSVPPAAHGALPIVTFENSVSIHLNGEEVRAVFFPHGHTDGDCVIFFTRSNVVHMGDDFFNGMFPFIDVDNGGSVMGMIAADDKVLSTLRDDAKVIPGHGALSDKAGLAAFSKMLKGTSAIVARAVKDGTTPAQLKAQKAFAEWDSWGQGFVKADFFIDMLYADLSRK
jgi:cyclase